jgi:hypothetical protein
MIKKSKEEDNPKEDTEKFTEPQYVEVFFEDLVFDLVPNPQIPENLRFHSA